MASSRSAYLLPSRQGIVGRFRQAAQAAWRAYVKRYNRRAAVHHLNNLDDRMLRDIGISRSQIESAVRSGWSPREM